MTCNITEYSGMLYRGAFIYKKKDGLVVNHLMMDSSHRFESSSEAKAYVDFMLDRRYMN